MSAEPISKTVLVTGCTPGGIGYELCKAFQKRGCTVIATARRQEVLDEISQSGMMALALDVTNSESIAACKEKVAEITGGRLDILINNAGVSHTIPAVDIDMSDVRNTFETNVFGVMAVTQSFIELLIAAKGLVVNVSSIASITPYIYGSVFCATKGAINSYSRTLRQELRPFGVRVTVVMAGVVKTGGTKVYRHLPDNSIYKLAEESFLAKLKYSERTASMSARDFATNLVDVISADVGWFGSLMGRSPNYVWLGGSALLVRWALWVGEWFLDAILYRKFGLADLERKLADKNRSAKST